MTSVVVCGDRPRISTGEADVVAVNGLCRDPRQLAALGIDATRIVLVLHPHSYNLQEVQTALRGIDIDPLGAQILDAVEGADDTTLAAALRGLVARSSAFAGSAPEHAKPVLAREVTRRGFLRPPAPVYIGAPRVDHSRCAAGNGCRACVGVCPRDAYQWQSGRVIYDKDACAPCGRCITACPTAAIENPTATPAMIEAQVQALLAAVKQPIGLRFVCSRGSIESKSGWFDVAVSCSSMVPGSWLLACLLLGAGAATVVPCTESGCPLQLDDRAVEANEFATSTLAAFGLDWLMVIGEEIPEPIASGSIEDPFGLHTAPDVMVALSAVAGQKIDLVHLAADMGVVEIDSSVCTLCGQCAATCPTHALTEIYDGDTVSISFDPSACVNCVQCVPACPELQRGAISVSGRVDVGLLMEGRVTLNQGAVVTCEVCGKAIAPAPMMERIGDILGDEFEGTTTMLASRCLDCRGAR